MKRTYETALKLLESRHRRARPSDGVNVNGELPAATRGMPIMQGKPSFRGLPSLVGMREWLHLLGHSRVKDSAVNALNVIHVAGTKGKGSTCAFTRSLLAAHATRSGFPAKIGLYTSPELTCVRERIQIDNAPIRPDLFTKYFFEVWDCLSAHHSPVAGRSDPMPRFLQLMALLALHTFIREQTDATVIETHNGGEYDATNVIRQPVVTGITTIGMDHIAQLGPTIEDIAWHKSGVMKPGALSFTPEQGSNIAGVLKERARQKGVSLAFVDVDPDLPAGQPALKAPVQQTNCSVAIAMANAFLRQRSPSAEPLTLEDVALGVERFNWPGRFQVIDQGGTKWFIDGAHNELSISQAAQWFARTVGVRQPFVLVFSHFNEERDGLVLLQCLASALKDCAMLPSHVVFTTYQERQDGTSRPDKTIRPPEAPFPVADMLGAFRNLWSEFDGQADIVTEESIEGALLRVQRIGLDHSSLPCFITGSLHLVGGALSLLQPAS